MSLGWHCCRGGWSNRFRRVRYSHTGNKNSEKIDSNDLLLLFQSCKTNGEQDCWLRLLTPCLARSFVSVIKVETSTVHRCELRWGRIIQKRTGREIGEERSLHSQKEWGEVWLRGCWSVGQINVVESRVLSYSFGINVFKNNDIVVYPKITNCSRNLFFFIKFQMWTFVFNDPHIS